MKFKYIGGICLGLILYDPLQIIYKQLFLSVPSFDKYGINSYAIVTGATDGIGKGFCEILAAKGVNLILVSRNQNLLDKVSKELSDRYKIKIITHAIDLSSAAQIDYENLKEKTNNIDISILINNAGCIPYKTITELSYSDIKYIMNLNAISMMVILQMYLPRLYQRQAKSAIINVSSFLAIDPTPVVSIYSSTKAFNHYASMRLFEEYGKEIDILSFQPSTVITKALLNEKESWKSCSVKQAVSGALKDLGRKKVSYGHWNHEILAWGQKFIPEALRIKLAFWYIKKTIKRRLNK